MEKTLNQVMFYSFLIGYIFKIEIPKTISEYVMSNEVLFDANIDLKHVVSMLKGGDLQSPELRSLIISIIK